MRAHEFINEILSVDGPAPDANWHTDKDDGITTSKWVDPTGKEIKTKYVPSYPGSVRMDFSRDQNGRARRDITGTGGSATPKILSGVSQNIKTYLDNNPDIDSVYFTSLDPSRTKAYSRMIDRLAPKAGLAGTRTDNVIGGTGFNLTRAQPGQQHVPLVAPKSATPPAAATKLPPPGKAIPPSVMGKPFSPSIAGSHNSPGAQAFQDQLDAFKRKMPRI
jgi:hypothetical protein